MTGGSPIPSYSPADLSIGAILNVFGRNVVLTDCDPYTKEYYRVTYGFGKFFMGNLWYYYFRHEIVFDENGYIYY